MKEIVFRPLRRIKKTGKITVASYSQWRKIKSLDCREFKLIIDTDYKKFYNKDFVYNHKGEELFFKNFNPNDIVGLNKNNFEFPKMWKNDFMFSASGLDVDGVPTFSNGTINNLYSNEKLNEYSLLTVEVVVFWFGWFIYQLKNNELIFK